MSDVWLPIYAFGMGCICQKICQSEHQHFVMEFWHSEKTSEADFGHQVSWAGLAKAKNIGLTYGQTSGKHPEKAGTLRQSSG